MQKEPSSLMALKYPMLLDGGLSNQLEDQGCTLHPTLWTAELLRSNPEAIVKAHLSYLEAGAQCIITASYQATVPGFKKIGMGQTNAEKLILKSVNLAIKAIGQYRRAHPGNAVAKVAASIGPYGAYLADGSEYSGNYCITDKELYDFHLPKIQLLAASEADFLACETIPSFREAKVLSQILKDIKKPSWMTFTCGDERNLRDGTPVVKSIRLFNQIPGVFAVGVNCTNPRFITKLIKAIKPAARNKKIIVYPNSGEIYHGETKQWESNDQTVFSIEKVKEWIELGVGIVGGCCRVGPDKIKEIADMLAQK